MNQALADRLLAEPGVSPMRLQTILRLPYSQARVELDKLKQQAMVLYRRAVFKYHPDRNPDNPDAARIVVALGEVLRHVEGLEVRHTTPSVVRYVQEDIPAGTEPFQGVTAGHFPKTYDATLVVFIKV